MGPMGLIRLMSLIGIISLVLASCDPRPPLHLYDQETASLDLPVVDLDLRVYWDYEMAFGINYDWEAEWYYGWDTEDREKWGELGYVEPTVFNLRRYYTGSETNVPHKSVRSSSVNGHSFKGRYEWGFWDILCWNQITTLDGIQSLIFDEETTLDSVTARTRMTMYPSRYEAPKYTRSFNAPEPLFAAYEQSIEINKNLDGFVFDPERNLWVKTLDMLLRPITYIYLTQIILHHNNGRVKEIDPSANLSGLARTTTLNSGRGGDDAVTVFYKMRMKKDIPLVPYKDLVTEGYVPPAGVEHVDIIGGRLMTFGICGTAANNITSQAELRDPNRHYMDVTMRFSNEMDSVLVFDVTDQVRRRYKGGVITIELDMDTVPMPKRNGGSGFNAVVKDIEDGGTWEFEM